MAKVGHNAKAIAHAKYSLWAKKIKLPQTCEKRFYKTFKLLYEKKRLKKQLYSKNESILKMAKNGHNAKAIAHAKWAVWVKN